MEKLSLIIMKNFESNIKILYSKQAGIPLKEDVADLPQEEIVGNQINQVN